MQEYIQRFLRGMRAAFIEDDDGGAKSRRSVVLAGTMESIVLGITTGAFYTALIHAVFAGEPATLRNGYLGWIISLSYLARCVQLLMPFLARKLKSWARFYRSTRASYYLIQCVLIPVVCYTATDTGTKATLIILLVFLSEMLFLLANPLLCKWYIGNVPQSIYPDWFSGQQLIITVCTTLTVIGASYVLDRFTLRASALLGVFVLRFAALVPGAVEMLANSRVRIPLNATAEEAPRFMSSLQSLLRNKAYCRILLLCCLWAYILMFPGQYYVSYLLSGLSYSYTFLNIATLFSIPMMLLMMPFWLKQVHLYGWYKPYLWISLCYVPVYVANAFVFKSTPYLYILAVLAAQFLLPGANMVTGSLPFQSVPEGHETAYLAIFNAVCNLSRFLGAYSGQLFIAAAEGKSAVMLGLRFESGQLICLVCATLYLLFSALLVFVIRRQKALKDIQIAA